MRNLTTEEEYLFTYENWLSKTKGPKRTKVCELAAVVDDEEMVEKTTFIIQVQTSDIRGRYLQCICHTLLITHGEIISMYFTPSWRSSGQPLRCPESLPIHSCPWILRQLHAKLPYNYTWGHSRLPIWALTTVLHNHHRCKLSVSHVKRVKIIGNVGEHI